MFGNKIMLYLLLVLLSLTVIWFYVGFIRKKTEYYLLPRIRGGFFIIFALSIIIIFAIYREFTAEYEVSKYIVPYSGNMEAIYTPAIPGSKSQIWLFKSTDSPKQVELFYSKKENLRGWKVMRSFPFMTIRRNKKEIVISVTAQQNTLITYELREVGM